MDPTQQRRLLSPMCVGQSFLLTILLAVGISNIVLLTNSSCSFRVEAIPILITCIFGFSVLDHAFMCIYNRRRVHDELPFMQQQRDPLIQAQNMDYFAAANPTKDNMAWLVKFYNTRVSTAGALMSILLDCIPFALCTLWIYALVTHSASSHLQEPICQTRFWYSLAQSVVFTPLSFCGIISVTIRGIGLCKRRCCRE